MQKLTERPGFQDARNSSITELSDYRCNGALNSKWSLHFIQSTKIYKKNNNLKTPLGSEEGIKGISVEQPVNNWITRNSVRMCGYSLIKLTWAYHKTQSQSKRCMPQRQKYFSAKTRQITSANDVHDEFLKTNQLFLCIKLVMMALCLLLSTNASNSYYHRPDVVFWPMITENYLLTFCDHLKNWILYAHYFNIEIRFN